MKPIHEQYWDALYEIAGSLGCATHEAKDKYEDLSLQRISMKATDPSDLFPLLASERRKISANKYSESMQFACQEEYTPAGVMEGWLAKLEDSLQERVPAMYDKDIKFCKEIGRSIYHQCLAVESICRELDCYLHNICSSYKALMMDNLRSSGAIPASYSIILLAYAEELRNSSEIWAETLGISIGESVVREDSAPAFMATWLEELSTEL